MLLSEIAKNNALRSMHRAKRAPSSSISALHRDDGVVTPKGEADFFKALLDSAAARDSTPDLRRQCVQTILDHISRYISRHDAAASQVRFSAAARSEAPILMFALHAQVKQLEEALVLAQSASQHHGDAAVPALEQLHLAQLQLQSQADVLDKLSARRDKLKRKNASLKIELVAAAREREALVQQVDSAVAARAAAEEAVADARAVADAARREKQDGDGAVSAAAARSASCAAEVKSLRHELQQAEDARDSAQSMLSAINDRCFELMQQCRHLTQLQHEADARADAAQSQLADVTRDFDSRLEATSLDLQQEETRACEEEAARCKLELRAHDLAQRLRAAEAALDVARQQSDLQHVRQHDFEKLHGKMAKQAAELRLARDEVQPSRFARRRRPPPRCNRYTFPRQITALRSRASAFDEEILALRRQMLKVRRSVCAILPCFCGQSSIISLHIFQVGGGPCGRSQAKSSAEGRRCRRATAAAAAPGRTAAHQQVRPARLARRRQPHVTAARCAGDLRTQRIVWMRCLLLRLKMRPLGCGRAGLFRHWRRTLRQRARAFESWKF